MSVNIDKILKEIESKIDKFNVSPLQVSDFGVVESVSDGIVTASGLDKCMMSEMVEFPNGEMGVVLNLWESSVGIVVLGDYGKIKYGDKVTPTGKLLSVSVGENMLGRVVNPLMLPVDGGNEIDTDTFYPVEKIAPGVMERQPVSEPLQTGIMAVDALVPIGRGQRELIIGDRQTGKTAVAIDTILNQKGKNVKCIYVAIGQKKSKVMRVVETLRRGGAMDYTTVVLAGSSDSPALLYIAPYAGVALAEYFMDKGDDVLIVYDDLTKHANAYREISLLLRRPPGREAYPGDVFYLHSRLLERACRMSEENGGGSITALPIIETQAGDVSGYIPTNVISITDGQIYLEGSLFHKGIRPAINPGLSVSRVGGSAQIKSMKKNAGPMKLAMAQYFELESFAQFDSDLDEATKSALNRGKRVIEIMKQKQSSPLDVSLQIAVIYAVNNGFLDKINVEDVAEWKEKFINFMSSSKSSLMDKLKETWSDELKNELHEACKEFFDMQE